MQDALDRSLTTKEKDQFYKEISDLMLDGDLTKISDSKKLDAFVKSLEDKNVSESVITELTKTIDDARYTIGNLIDSTGKYNPKELKDASCYTIF
jgi:hypothetical protein